MGSTATLPRMSTRRSSQRAPFRASWVSRWVKSEATGGEPLEVEVSLEAAPSVLWDAAVFLEGESLSASGQALEFLKDQYRHCKPILLLDGASALLDKADIPPAMPSGDSDPGLIRVDDSDLGRPWRRS